jgi:SAM-dependent methyltransferase
MRRPRRPRGVRIDPTVYEGHYRWRREEGWPGWFSEEALDDVLEDLSVRVCPPKRRGRKALEVGCGAGDQSLFLAQLGFDVTGVDISPTAIEWAKEKASNRGVNAQFLVGDVRDLSAIPDSSFDLVLDGNCWHFIIGEGRARFLQSVYRVLRPGGLFLVNSVCNLPADLPDINRHTRVHIVDGVAVTYFGDAEELLRDLSEAGFKVESHVVKPGEAGKVCDFLHAQARRPRA